MTRARCVLGESALRQRFDAVREAVIGAERDSNGLREEIDTMRQASCAAHPVRGEAI
jgi:glutamate-ammonia-ligase adenylyltransferase